MVDDGSKDDTYTIPLKLNAEDSRVKCLKLHRNRGKVKLRDTLVKFHKSYSEWTFSVNQLIPDKMCGLSSESIRFIGVWPNFTNVQYGIANTD